MPLLTGGEILAEYLVKEGVPYAVGIPGHGCMGIVDAFAERRDRIGVIQVRHEQSACHLADGYYRVSGRPLAVFTSIGPGACNTVVGVATAYVDSSALILFTGSVHTYSLGTGVLQEIERKRWADFPSIIQPVVKRSWQITRVDQLPRVLPHAFNLALTGRPGPVHIDMPMDIQAESADVEVPEPLEHRAGGRVRGDPESIMRAAQLLIKAERPVILAGGGTVISGASQELLELCEFLGAPVVTTWGTAKGVLPEDHPLCGYYPGSMGSPVGNRLTSQADILLAIGCRFADLTTSSYKPGIAFSIPPTRLIQVDIDAGEIGKNYPVEVGVIGDSKAVIQDLLNALKSLSSRRRYEETSYFKEVQRLREEWHRELEERRGDAKLTISRFLKELRETLERDAIVLASAGHPQVAVAQEFPVYYPRTQVSSGGFSTMGFGLPAGLGAKLAAPQRQVVAVEGDGSFLMTCPELATAVQHDVPVVVTVLNNMGWISIRDLQISVYGKDRVYASEFTKRTGELVTPDFVRLAEAFGCFSTRVEKPGEVGQALRKALQSGRPSVVEVMVERDYPRSGGKGYGWWDVPVPGYLRTG